MNPMARGKHRIQLNLERARNDKFLACLEQGYSPEEANLIASSYFIVASDLLAQSCGELNAAQQASLDASNSRSIDYGQ